MSELCDRLDARMAGANWIRIEIPEWADGDDTFIAYSKPWTLADERRVARWIKDDSSEGFAAVVVNKLCTIDGDALFDTADRVRLMRNTEAHVLKRIAGEIMGSTIDQEEAAKNSDPTRT